MPRGKRFSEEEKQKIIELRKQRLYYTEIAKKIGISLAAVARYLQSQKMGGRMSKKVRENKSRTGLSEYTRYCHRCENRYKTKCKHGKICSDCKKKPAGQTQKPCTNVNKLRK